jgi:hypothetical protein
MWEVLQLERHHPAIQVEAVLGRDYHSLVSIIEGAYIERIFYRETPCSLSPIAFAESLSQFTLEKSHILLSWIDSSKPKTNSSAKKSIGRTTNYSDPHDPVVLCNRERVDSRPRVPCRGPGTRSTRRTKPYLSSSRPSNPISPRTWKSRIRTLLWPRLTRRFRDRGL